MTQLRGRMQSGWGVQIWLLGLVLLVAAGVAAAEEPPGAAASAAAEDTPAPPAPPVGPGEDWSPPAAGESALPPPEIRRRRATPSSAAVAVSVSKTRIKDVPTDNHPRSGGPSREAPPLPMPPPPMPPAPMPPAPERQPAQGLMPPQVPLSPQAPASVARTGILGIAKTHDIAGPDGQTWLQLDVQYQLVGEAGRDVYVGVWFVRKEGGQYLRSALAIHADPRGHVTLQTHPARVTAGDATYLASMRIPYAAFPVTRDGESYEILARVQVLRQAGAGLVQSLARGETTFTVYAPQAPPAGVPAGPEAAPLPPLVPVPGPAGPLPLPEVPGVVTSP